MIFNKASELFKQLKKQAQNTEKVYTSVTFEDCKFSTIVSELLNEKNLDLANLTRLNFTNIVFEEIQSNVFDFKVKKLVMNNVKIDEFTTETFKKLNPNARIEVMNSQINGRSRKDTTALRPLKIRELTFDNVTINAKSSKQFINIQADRVFIKNSNLDSFEKGTYLRKVAIRLKKEHLVIVS